MYLDDSMPVLGGFDLPSGDLGLGPRSQLHFLSKAQLIGIIWPKYEVSAWNIFLVKSENDIFIGFPPKFNITMETIPYSYVGSVIRT